LIDVLLKAKQSQVLQEKIASRQELLDSALTEEMNRSSLVFDTQEMETLDFFHHQEGVLKERQEKEIELYRVSLEDSISRKCKASSRVIELRERVKKEARIQDFYEAHEHLQQATRLLEREQQMYSEKRKQRIESLIASRRATHQKETQNLAQRKEDALSELKLQKNNDQWVLGARFSHKKMASTQSLVKSEIFDTSRSDINFHSIHSQSLAKMDKSYSKMSLSSRFVL
jgi:hypothetical protein